MRQLSAVTFAALIGSIVGTLIWVLVEGGTGAHNPVRFVTAFALGTIMFTLPGVMLLMYLTFKLADRGVKRSVAGVLLLAAGTLGGASMLAFSTPNFIALGALYGFVTAAAFVAALSLLKVFRFPGG